MFAFLLSIIFLVVVVANGTLSYFYELSGNILLFHSSSIITLLSHLAFEKTVTITHPNGLMFGGNIIKINEAPYHVSIRKFGKPRCAGVILSKDYVLTAAHCDLSDLSPSIILGHNIKVRAGSSLRNSEGSLHSVIQCYVHENYPKSPKHLGIPMDWDESRYIVMTNDIALLKISPPIEFDEKRQPIVMFDEGENRQGVKALVTGWTNINGSEHLTTQTVDILYFTEEDSYKNFGGIPAGQICASYPWTNGKTGCVGVSGGPLVVDGRLAGILSWGNGCVRIYGPGVYTEIAYYRRWIDETMKKHN